MRNKLPPAANLRKLFIYEPDTGKLFWAETMQEAFTGKGGNGRPRMQVDGERHYAHRIIWRIMTGYDPSGAVQHINGDTSDNRWENLTTPGGKQYITPDGEKVAIDKHIPIPVAKPGRGYSEPPLHMEVGDSFLVENLSDTQTPRNRMRAMGWHCTVRKAPCGAGYRIWRTK